MTGQAVPEPERKKRGRPKKDEFKLDAAKADAGPATPSTIVENVPSTLSVQTETLPSEPESKTKEEWEKTPEVPFVEPATPVVIDNLPNNEQKDAFRTRLTKYTQDILPAAGMVPSDNIGGVAMKVRLFAQKLFPSVSELKNLNVDQWTEFLATLDAYEQNNGASELVKYIDSEIGA